MTSVTVRVDDETKVAAAKIVEDMGLDLSSVTRAFYRQIVREQRIPLSFSYAEPNEESIRALHESREIIAQGGTRDSYTSAKDLLDAAYKA